MSSRMLSFKASITVQRCQITAPWWRNDISSTADNAIFKNRAQNNECSFGCMARSAVLLKPNVVNVLLLYLCEQKFVQHGPTTIAIDCNGPSMLIFEEKWPNYACGPKSAPNSDSFWVRRLFNVCVQVFCAPKCDNFAFLHTRQDQNELHLKRCFCQNRHLLSITGPLSEAKFKRIHNHIRSAEG